MQWGCHHPLVLVANGSAKATLCFPVSSQVLCSSELSKCLTQHRANLLLATLSHFSAYILHGQRAQYWAVTSLVSLKVGEKNTSRSYKHRLTVTQCQNSVGAREHRCVCHTSSLLLYKPGQGQLWFYCSTQSSHFAFWFCSWSWVDSVSSVLWTLITFKCVPQLLSSILIHELWSSSGYLLN